MFVLCGNQLLLVENLLLLSVYSGTGRRRNMQALNNIDKQACSVTHLLKLLISINNTKLFTFCLSRKISHSVQGQHFVVLVLDGVVCYGKEIEVL